MLLQACTSPHFLRLLPSTQRALQANKLFAYQYAELSRLAPQQLGNECQRIAQQSPDAPNKDLQQLICAQLWLDAGVALTQQPVVEQLYNQSLIRLLHQLQPKNILSRPALRLELQPILDETGQHLSEWWISDQFQSRVALYQPPQAGLGVSIVAKRDHNHSASDKNFPPEGVYRSYTVLLERVQFNAEQQIQLFFRGYDQQGLSSHAWQQHHYPIRFDAAASYLWLMQHAKVASFELTGLFSPDQVDNALGIYSVTPLDATKTPVLMIHGLNSSPMIWFPLSLALLQDPELSARYQIWHAFYPSGPPPFFNAMQLRRSTDELMQRLQHQQPSPALNQMVIIGHSMGGLISKTFVQNSGHQLWDRTFVVRPDRLPVKAEELTKIHDIFYFQAKPYIAKAIFLDTPHGGSTLSESWLGRLTSALITLPASFMRLFNPVLNKIRKNQITEQMQPYLTGGGPTSVQVLSPSHPLLQCINQLPYQVPVYSVIGSQTELNCYDTQSCSRITDGVVPYLSAFQANASGQIIVPSSHNSYQSSAAINYILQLLRDSPALAN